MARTLFTTDQYVTRRNHGIEFDRTDARTVASWWYGPRDPGLVALVTADKVLPSLVDEVSAIKPTSTDDTVDVAFLLQWARTAPVDLSD